MREAIAYNIYIYFLCGDNGVWRDGLPACLGCLSWFSFVGFAGRFCFVFVFVCFVVFRCNLRRRGCRYM